VWCDGAGRVWCMVPLLCWAAGLSVRIMAIMLPLRLLKTSFRMRFDMHPCVCVCRHFEGQNHCGEGHVTVRACLPQHKQIL
jgi:hypothetical protein